VANVASKKIDEAIALLAEYRTDIGEGPGCGVEPKSPAAQQKRKGK
jgi:hypothetical protein